MAFHITKALGPGSIRFKVNQRRSAEELENEPLTLSTGPNGEYIGSRGGLYFAEKEKSAESPILELARQQKLTGTFWDALTPLQMGLMALGVIFILIGIVVLMRKGAPGMIEVVIGLALIVVPVVMTAKRRSDLRQQIELERSSRDAADQRRRDVLTSFLNKLEKFEHEMTEENAEALRREHSALSVEYDLLAPVVRQTVTRIGFRLLTELTSKGAEYVADGMDFAREATELAPHDIAEAKRQIYETPLWHLFADDRFGPAHDKLFEEFRMALRLDPEAIGLDIRAIDDFRRLRGVRYKRLPNIEVPTELGYQEICYHFTKGTLLSAPRKIQLPNAIKSAVDKVEGTGGECDVYITSKRLIIASGDPREIALSKIYAIDLDVDRNALVVTDAARSEPYELSVPDAVYTGAMLDLAIAAAV